MRVTDEHTVALDGHVVRGTYTAASNPRAVILMIHGITSNRAEWGYYELMSVALGKNGVSSLAIDLRGHGESKLGVEKLSLSGAMLDIHAAWDLLLGLEGNESLNRFVIGNSFGGGITYLFGNQTQGVDHIFLTAPVLSYIEDIGDMRTAWENTGLSTFKYVKFDLSSLLVPEMFYFDSRIVNSAGTVPFTIIHGEADADVLFEGSSSFVSKNTAGSLIGLPGMDHCWAKPGDLPPFIDPQSVENRKAAVEVTVENILSRIC